MAEYTCKKCGEVTAGRITPHSMHGCRVDCAACGAFIKWGAGDKSWKDKAVDFVLFIAELAEHREPNTEETKLICKRAKELAGEARPWLR